MSERRVPCESGNTIGYRVEARDPREGSWGGKPTMLGDTVLTATWRRLHFKPAVVGVPNNLHCPIGEQRGLLTYRAAQALAAWALAACGWSMVEVRLVKVEIKYEWSEREIGVGEPFSYGVEDEHAATFAPRATPTDSKSETP